MDGTRERRRDPGYTRLACTARCMVCIEQIDDDGWRLAHPQHRRRIKILRDRRTLRKANVAIDSRREPKDDATLYLRIDRTRIDHLSTIEHGRYPLDLHTPSRDDHFDDFCAIGTVSDAQRDTSTASLGEWLTPLC